MTLHPLGRIKPDSYEHVAAMPLTLLPPSARPVNVPVAIGINWYTQFDTPVKRSGAYWIAPKGPDSLTTVRGGHCVCLEPAPAGEQDEAAWWEFYNQGNEGACVGFGTSRMMSLLRRREYDAFWLYHEAQKHDGIHGPHEGTTVHAACQVLQTEGPRREGATRETPSDGVSAVRWATTVADVLATLGFQPNVDFVTVLNSWGTAFPQRVRMPVGVLARLLAEGGEAAVVTER